MIARKEINKLLFYVAVQTFITLNARILFHKAHLQKSIPFIFICEKVYTYSPSEWRGAVSRVEVSPTSDSVKASPRQSESCIVYIQIAFKIWRLFFSENGENEGKFQICVGLLLAKLVCTASRKQEHTVSKIQRDDLLFKKNLVSRNELREIIKY